MSDRLDNSLRILAASAELLESAADALAAASLDVPRLARVLKTQKIFALVPELDLDSAKLALQRKKTPQISHMVTKVTQEVGRLRRKRAVLENKAELQKVRLDTGRTRDPQAVSADVARLRQLHAKKEKLRAQVAEARARKTPATPALSQIPLLPPQ